MKCLLIVIFMYADIMWCQDLVFPTNGEISHVSGNNPTVITERMPVSTPIQCPKDMLLYAIDNITSVCDCKPRFLYFPLNDSCHEAYRQGPCPLNHYVVLPDNETDPRCVKNPCMEDGIVLYNNTCYPLNGPCAPNGVLDVNETTFQLECIQMDIKYVLTSIIVVPDRECVPGTRRNKHGQCKQVI